MATKVAWLLYKVINLIALKQPSTVDCVAIQFVVRSSSHYLVLLIIILLSFFVCFRDSHNGHLLYTRSSVMDTMDMCYTRHLVSLVILSLHCVQSCHCLRRFYKYSVSTVYFSYLAVFHCYILLLPFAILNRIFCSNHYIGGSGGMATTLAV